MEEPTPLVRRRCSACRSVHTLAINTLLAAGASSLSIEREMKRLGAPIKAETVRAHLRICLQGKPELTQEQAVEVGRMGSLATNEAERDFATLIQKRAMQLLEAGEIRVTAAHGLQAQALIDRRAEKAADRDLAVNIARLLSGAIMETPLRVIEGTAYDVEAGLAPARLIEG
jgi:hypothetical protein